VRLWDPRPSLIAAAIALTAFLLAVCYGVVTPLWEGNDEPIHFDVVKHIAEHGRLPTLFDKGAILGQNLQPPLFYALSAAIVHDVDMSDLNETRVMNPFFWGLELGEEHAYAIHPDGGAWPWIGTSLAVHRIRILQSTFLFVTVVATYAIGREIFPSSSEPALLTAFIAAFVPGFVKIHSYVNNDALLAMLASLVTLTLVRAAIKGVSTRRSLTVGALLGLALLTKQSVVFFVPVYLLLIGREALRQRSVRVLITESLALLLPIAVLVGWWYRRNVLLYGDPLGTAYYFKYAVNPDFPALTPGYVWKAARLMVERYWGRFGWGSIRMHPGVYLAGSTFVLTSIGGYVYRALRVRSSEGRRVLGERAATAFRWLGLLLLALLAWFALYLIRIGPVALQARYFYPLHAGLSVLVAGGLWQLARGRREARPPSQVRLRRGAALLVGLFCVYLFCIAVLAPFVYIMPQFN
jgi:4-amino-4-deoxy-L-arabinose transferase-like glycosyltransferase